MSTAAAHHRLSRIIVVASLAIATLVVGTASLWLSVPIRAADEQPLRYRRILVPTEQVEDLNKLFNETAGRKLQYWPTRPDEFEALVKELGSSEQRGPSAHDLAIQQAEYRASFVNGALVGTAEWTLEPHDGPPALRAVEPFRMAAAKPRWLLEPDEKPAVLGSGPHGTMRLLVEHAAPLALDWSLAGRTSEGEVTTFDIAMPECPDNRLVIDLPERLAPLADDGVVLPPEMSEAEGHRLWTIALGRHNRTRLVIAPDPAVAGRQVVFKESLTYQITRGGLELSARYDLEALNGLWDDLTVELDPAGVLLSASDGGQPIEWTTDTKTKAIRLQLKAGAARARIVRLRCFFPLRIGEDWTVPVPRLQGPLWLQGRSTIRVVEPLVLESLRPVSDEGRPTCQVLEASRTTTPPGESVLVRHDVANAAFTIRLGEVAETYDVTSGVAIDWELSSAKAKITADLSTERSRLFRITASVGERWLVDSVSTEPPEILADWQFRPQPGGRGQLILDFAKPLTDARPVRVDLTARWSGNPPSEIRDLSQTVPLLWQAADSVDTRLAITAAADLDIVTEDLSPAAQVSWDGLDALWRQRLADAEPEWLFDPAYRGRLAIRPQPVTFTGTWNLSATIHDDRIAEELELQVRPDGGRKLDSIQVAWPGGPHGMWIVEDNTSGDPVGLEVTPVPESAGVPEGTLQLNFNPPQSTIVRLRCRRERPATPESISIATPRLPTAATHRGLLLVRQFGDLAFTAETIGLEPALVPDEIERAPATRAYRRPVGEDSEGILVLQPAGPAPQGPIVWRRELTSHYRSDGSGTHVAVFDVQAAAPVQLELDWPKDSEPLGLWVNGVLVTQIAQDQPATVALKSRQDLHRIVLSFRHGTAWQRGPDQLAPAWPTISAPVLESVWQLHLPTGRVLAAPPLGWNGPDSRELSWSERLLAPLGRPRGVKPFPIFDGEAWLDLFGQPNEAAEQLAGAERFLDRYTTTAALPEVDWPENWARLFSQLIRGNPGPGGFWLDEQALSAAGIEPHFTWRGQSFVSADLVLFVLEDGRWVLTTRTAAEEWTTPSERRVARLARLANPQLDRLVQEAGRMPRPRFIPLAAWSLVSVHQDNPIEQPSLAFPQSVEGDAEPLVLRNSGEASQAIVTVEQGTVAGWTVAAFALCAGIGVCWPSRRSGWLLLASALVIAAALVCPPEWCPLPSAALWGFILATLWRLVRVDPQSLPAPVSGVRLRMTAATLVIILGGGLAVVAQQGEPPAVNTQPVRDDYVYPVFVRADSNRQPIAAAQGGTYWVPIELFLELRRRVALVRGTPQAWLWTDSEYQWNEPETPDDGPTVSATMRLVTFGASQEVLLPIPPDDLRALPPMATLDGRPTALNWDLGARGCYLLVPTEGEHRLQVDLAPFARPVGLEADAAFGIPRAPRSTLILPTDRPSLTVPTHLGESESTPQSRSVELGPIDRLAVRWPLDRTATTTGQQPKVRQLMWLKVLPGRVVLEMRLTITPVAGQPVSEVAVESDPAYQLLQPWSSAALAGQQIRAANDGTRVHLLTFTRPIFEPTTLEATFLLRETSEVGNLRLPPLGVTDGIEERRWLAVSVDPSLEVGSPDWPRVEANLFGAAWGGPGPVVSVGEVFDLTTPREGVWTLTTRPKDPVPTVAQTIVLELDRTEAVFRLELAFPSGGPPGFAHAIHLPAAWRLQGAEVAPPESERLAFSQNEDGTATLVISAAHRSARRFRLWGRIDLAGQPLIVEPVRLAGMRVSGTRVEIARRRGTVVTVKPSGGFTIAADEPPPLVESIEALPVGAYLLANTGVENPRLTVSVRPSQSTVKGRIVTSVEPSGDEWKLRAVAVIEQVDGDPIDAISIARPPQWMGPFEPDSIVTLREENSGRQGGSRLELLPHQPITGATAITIRGFLRTWPERPTRIPVITTPDLQLDPLLLLPESSPNGLLVWETNQLEAVPPEERPAGVVYSGVSVFRVTGPRPSAELTATAVRGEPDRITLTDIRIQSTPQGWQALSSFWIEAAMRTEVRFTLPQESSEVLAVWLNGHPAAARWDSSGDRRGLAIPVVPDEGPALIEILTRVAGQGVRPEAAVPEPQSLVSREYLWTSAPWPAEPTQSQAMLSGFAPMTAEPEARRARAFLELRSRQLAPIWQGMGHHLLERLVLAAQLDPESSVGPLSTDLQDHLIAASRPDVPSQASTLALRWDDVLPNGVTMAGRIDESASARPNRDAFPLSQSQLMRWIAAAAVLLLTLLFLAFVPRTTRESLLRDRLAAFGVLAGVGWWLFLDPSLVGIAIALVSMVLSLSTGWPGTKRAKPLLRRVG